MLNLLSHGMYFKVKSFFKKNCFREQLDAIQTQPLLRRATTNATQQYPYVFDEFAARKHASSFIGGTKVMSFAIFLLFCMILF